MMANCDWKNNFNHAVKILMENWIALQTGVNNGIAGKDSHQLTPWMIDTMSSYFFDNDNLMVDEVEQFMDSIFREQFDYIIEDESLPWMANNLCESFKSSREGNIEQLNTMLSRIQGKTVRISLQVESDDEDEASSSNQQIASVDSSKSSEDKPEESEDMQVDEPQQSTSGSSNLQTDQDGWTVVRRKK